MSNVWLIAIIVGSVIIAGLAFYAGMLLMQLKQQKQAHFCGDRGKLN